jgi:hypothetical protein
MCVTQSLTSGSSRRLAAPRIPYDLAHDAVGVLVAHAQLGDRGPHHARGLVAVEAVLGHPVGAMDVARHVRATGRAHAADQAQRRSLVRDPDAPARRVDHARHALAQLGGRVVAPQVLGHERKVDVAVGGEDRLVHRPIIRL